ncbi:phage antirepressor KilAC domain-containing protein [Eubacterium sp. 1001713B170207_170306_E7]|uniref:phage antirepressor KilAC domain-containing protein n=1 Tax=Eubacterium sp. 1001713B170207_170306_E7 TaxID=2787097 RepID=UPI001897AAEE|nr:phage antirepressor KilAC domain-containing protein [Eubacterium sp. 1001713B170207_170306_E7]
MNCKQTTPTTAAEQKGLRLWCVSCALNQKDRISGSFERLSNIDMRIELCFLEKQLTALQEEYEKKARIYLEDDCERQAYKSVRYEETKASEDDIPVSRLAGIMRQEGLNIGRNQLYVWLRERGFACFNIRCNRNLPTQKSLDKKYMTIVYKDYVEKRSGRLKQSPELRITPAGQAFFIRALAEERSRV